MFETRKSSSYENTKHTTMPTHIGSSVIGIKYDKGVVIAGDNKLNIHGYKKFVNVTRIAPINKNVIMGSSGEYSDFQELNRLLVEKAEEDELYDGVNSFFGPKEVASYLSYISYQKRSKMDPYWNTTLIGGFDENGDPFLNSVDQFGTKYQQNYLVSGFGLYFAGPILENAVPKNHKEITKEKAIELMDHVFRVLFYRDASAGDRIYYGVISKEENQEPSFNLLEKKLETNWEHEMFKRSHNEKYHPMA